MKQESIPHPKAVEDCHQLILWVIGHIDKFPRNRKFTLGDRIEQQLLEILKHLVSAGYGYSKAESLTQANNKLATTRHLWRLAFELKVISVKSYEYGSKLMLELGRQIGGWRKQADYAKTS